MRFYDAYEYEIDTSLCKTEKRLKDLYFKNQDRHLEKPHDIKDCRDIFVKASQTEDCLFPKFLVDNLEEDLFFHKNLDCEIYKHFRYLPCNWHSHSFLEVLCVLHGSCYNYIQEHFATVTLKELSSFFNYSERQLQRIIKSSTGMSFSENIQQLRMNQAIRLLANPDISIAVISEELGYSDIGNFRQAFKKFYAMTPLEYRNRTR